MRLAIVHLTDLHIQAADAPVLKRAAFIADAIASVTPEPIQVILVWSGDIAFSGTIDQYRLAANLIEEVENSLKARPKVTLLGSEFVPGNHDCDFSQSGDARSPLLDTLPSRIGQLDPLGDMVQQITKPQDAFFDFLKSRAVSIKNALIWEHRYDADQTPVLVRCCNSAWTSQLPETPTLLYPSQIIEESKSPLTISVIHHPFSWFEPLNGKALRRKLEVDSDLILTGHEHDPDTFARSGRTSSTQYLEGAALAAANVQTGFTVSLVDMPTSVMEVFSFTWSDVLYTRSDQASVSFVRKQRAIVNRFVRSADFERMIDEVTTPFSHPRKELRLSDIYVDPPLTLIIPGADGKNSEQTIAAQGILDFVLAEKLVRVSASKGYGKTALARTFCRNFLDFKGMVPVYLDSQLMSGYDVLRTTTSIEKAFSKQYSPNLLEHFRQLGSGHKVIIFDDWDLLRSLLK